MEDIKLLLDRFLDFKNNGQNKYFDSDDIISLIEYFTEIDDVENLKIVITLGYELHPDNPEFILQVCRTLVYTGDYETALKLLENVDSEDDYEPDLLYIECLCELGMKEEALNFIDELAEEESPHLQEAIEHLARVLNDIDEYMHFAYGFILEYLQIYPDSELLNIELCYNLELQGKIKEAMTKCEELLQSNLHSAELWFVKGRLCTTCCEYGNAVEALDYALSFAEIEELKYEALLMKADCLQKNENYYSAINVYEELMTMKISDTHKIVSRLSECLILVEDFERAYQVLKDNLKSIDFEHSVTNMGNFIFSCVMTDRRNEAAEAICDAILSLPRDMMIENLTPIIALQSDINNIEQDEEEDDRQELVRSFINSNLHVN
ncbi:MAG: tetratricopeptide repeat protein [Tannerella sp.]|jgi:tetratricopeptide (TPR) repeat protein|nr:tetratricopeptide repeat protein [Tannerella sp.]